MTSPIPLATTRHAPSFWSSQSFRFHVRVIVSYVLLTLYVLARLVPHSATNVPGYGVATEDAWQNTWNMWWVWYALSHWLNPYETTMLYYPDGASLYLHTLNITNAIITLPVQLIAGATAAYNTAVLLGFVLSGYASFLLVQHIMHNDYHMQHIHDDAHDGIDVIAWAAGAIVTFSPFHLSRLWDGHLSWVTFQWVPLYMLTLLLALQCPTWQRTALAATMLALAMLTSWYYAIYCLLFTVLLWGTHMLAFMLSHHRQAPQAQHMQWLTNTRTMLIIGVLGGILVSPVLLPALSFKNNYTIPTAAYAADVIDWVFPSHLHPLWGKMARTWHNALYDKQWFWCISPGVTVFLLALYGTHIYWRTVWQWAIIAGVLLLLTLGDELWIAGYATHIPMPYHLLRYIPGASLGHRPNHFMLPALPLLALLAGYGIRALVVRRLRWILIAASILIVVEYSTLPFPIISGDVDPVFATMRGDSGAVLDLPRDQRTATAMRHQMLHERPIVGGYLAREPRNPPFVTQVPWLWHLWRLQPPRHHNIPIASSIDNGDDIIAERSDDAWQALSYYAIRTIVLRHAELSPMEEANVHASLAEMVPGITPCYTSTHIVRYEIPPVDTPHPFLFIGNGWYSPEHDALHTWRWMSNEATLHLVNPRATPQVATVVFAAESYQHERTLALLLDGVPYGTIDIARQQQQHHVYLLLSPGKHILTLQSNSDTIANTHRRVSLSFTSIALLYDDIQSVPIIAR